MNIVINSIQYNRSLVDGPGIRTVLFLQGCNVHCKGCHNQSSWDIKKGKTIEITELAELLIANCRNKKLTISGGEPLMQENAVLALIKQLKDFDITLYTSYDYEEINPEIIQYLTYLKTGKYIQELRTSVMPYVGSSNQVFRRIKDNETIKQ
ncbi:MAG: radical SAM protein [Anaeroplasmataceae bacterium]|nr:radical SAM protein [Anaeroplasmataceae bacterium]MDE6415385.1 radical SAM protein [Anaeroplasmataceae bacterium]